MYISLDTLPTTMITQPVMTVNNEDKVYIRYFFVSYCL